MAQDTAGRRPPETNIQTTDEQVEDRALSMSNKASGGTPIVVTKGRPPKIDSDHPYCALPAHYFDALLARAAKLAKKGHLRKSSSGETEVITMEIWKEHRSPSFVKERLSDEGSHSKR